MIEDGFNAEGALKSMKCYAEEELEIMERCKENVEQKQHLEDEPSICHNVVDPNMGDPFEGNTSYFDVLTEQECNSNNK